MTARFSREDLRMRTTVRWLMRLIGIAAFLVCVYVVLQAWLLPRLVKREVTSLLTGLGIRNATFVVQDANWHGIRLEQIKLGGEGAGGADVIEVSYSPREIINGKVGQVRIIGASLELKIQNGKVNFGALSTVERSDPSTKDEPKDNNAPLPFSEIDVRASTMKLNWEGRGLLLPVNGTVKTTGGGNVQLQLATAIQGSEVEVKGTIQTHNGDADLSVASDRLALAPVIALVPEDLTGGRIGGWGTVALHATYVTAGDTGKLSANLEGSEGAVTILAAGHRVAGEGLKMDVSGAVGPKQALTGSLTADVLRIDNQPLQKVRLNVEQSDQATRGRIEFDGGEYLIPRTAKLAGLAGAVEVTLPANANRLTVAAGSGLAVQIVEPAGTSWNVEPPHQGPATTIKLNRDAELRWGEGANGWTVSIGEAQVELAAAKFSMGTAQLSGASGVLVLRGQAGPDEATVVALDGTNFGIESAQVGTGDTATRLAATQAKVGAADSPILKAKYTDAGWDLAGNVQLLGGTPIEAVQGKRRIDCVAWTVAGNYALVNGAFAGAGAATVEGARYRDENAGMDIENVRGTLPVSWHAPKQKPGQLRMDAVTLSGSKFPGLSATLGFTDGRVDAAADWEPITGAKAHVEGWVDVLDTIKGEVRGEIPAFTITEAGDVGARIRQLGDAQITGTFAMGGSITFDGTNVKPHLKATVDNAAVSSTSYDFSLEQIKGSFEIDQFNPVQSPGSQLLYIKKIRIGKMEMSDGYTFARLESPKSIFFETVEFWWCRGRVFCNGFRLDPAHPVFQANVYGDGLQVPDVLKQVPGIGPDVTGTGTLFGRLPVKISADGAFFGNGFLYATPGVEKLSFGGSGDTVARLVTDQAGSNVGAQVKVALLTRLTSALRDFNYDRLRLDLNNDKDGLVGALQVHGKGTGEKAQEIDLTLNFRGVDKLFNQALVIKRKLGSIESGKDK